MISAFFRTYFNAIFSPTSLIGLTLIIGVVFLWKNDYHLAKVFLTVGTVLFVAVGLSPLRFGMFALMESETYEINEHYEYVVVLGTKTYPKAGHPISSQLSPSLLARLIEGVRLVNENPESKLILTGHGGGTAPEAKLMEQAVLAMGISSDRIILETKSMSTQEHPLYLRPILNNHKFVMVTSAFHMKRALKDFTAQGMNPIPFSTDFINKNTNPFDLENLIMRGENFSALDRWVAEFYSRIWAFFKRPSPEKTIVAARID